jgi:hypothetical protein
LIDRHPRRGLGPIERLRVVVRVEITHVVPGRIDERIHRIGVALGRAAARGTDRVDERGVVGQRRALASERNAARQHDRQLIVGHGNHTVALAVEHRDRRTPVALTRDQPVAETEVDRRLAATQRLEACGKLRARLGRREAGEVAARDQHAVGAAGRRDHGDDRQVVFLREIVVALVVRGDAHHGARAVFGQHVVRHPDRHARARERIDRIRAGRHAGLFHQLRALELRLRRQRRCERIDPGLALR